MGGKNGLQFLGKRDSKIIHLRGNLTGTQEL